MFSKRPASAGRLVIVSLAGARSASTASRRAVTVTVRSTATAGIADEVSNAVNRRLRPLQTPPQVKVRVRPQLHARKEVN